MVSVLLTSDDVVQRMYDGAVTAVEGLDYEAVVQSGQGRGSVTVQPSAGRGRSLMYLIGDYTAGEVESLRADSDCEVLTLWSDEFEVITEEFAVDHVQKWLFKEVGGWA